MKRILSVVLASVMVITAVLGATPFSYAEGSVNPCETLIDSSLYPESEHGYGNNLS